ncbi:disulfide bond formation protein B [Salibacterium salarium]|uniref:Probable disulfide formation protein n=1 Tax=Salibacterium salarium TaxID=284579 RepID=A0A428N9S2_9BACI|nr:disulfide oxidoreductase [Salibacterium salarium]RSL35101.1 disulfide bond formation protein B [Salibacterium salarium]
MIASLRPYVLYAAWLVSVVATFGSLYFSEVLGYVPCEFCWYQRIAMYPLVILLGIAAFYNDTKIVGYVLPLSIIGSLVSIYHYLMQKIPGFAPIEPCADGVPCQVQYVNALGFITIPFLALVAFTIITALLVFLRIKR